MTGGYRDAETGKFVSAEYAEAHPRETVAVEPVTINDVRAAGHCVRGAKEWFERHDLDFRAFLKHGISEQEFLASGDDMAQQVVDHKRMNSGG